jgi:hypothetical protein
MDVKRFLESLKMSLHVGSALQAAMSPKRGANKRCAIAASLREDDDETKIFKQAKESSTMHGVADESSFESSTTMRASMYALMTGSFWLTRCRRAVLTKYWVSAVQREAPDAINGAMCFVSLSALENRHVAMLLVY